MYSSHLTFVPHFGSNVELLLTNTSVLYLFCGSSEGNPLPIGLRGSGRRSGQSDQREAVLPERSAVSAAPEPGGPAEAHRHPGEGLLSLIYSYFLWREF